MYTKWEKHWNNNKAYDAIKAAVNEMNVFNMSDIPLTAKALKFI